MVPEIFNVIHGIKLYVKGIAANFVGGGGLIICSLPSGLKNNETEVRGKSFQELIIKTLNILQLVKINLKGLNVNM